MTYFSRNGEDRMRKQIAGLLVAIMGISLLTGCGGSKKPSTDNDFHFEVDPDFGSGNTGSKVEVVVEESYVHTGSVSYDYNGIASTWHQYEYDEEGALLVDREYNTYSNGYTEYKYTEDGLLESTMMCDEHGTAYAGNVYTYEKDASGKVLSRTCTLLNETKPINTEVYTYRADGTLEKVTQYAFEGYRMGEDLYDENENHVASYSYSGEEVEGYTYYSYDANGDLIEMRYANLMEPDEIVITYVNAYDDEGNLIFVNGYNWLGNLVSQELNAYADPATDYTKEDIEKQATDIQDKYYKCTVKEESHFALLKEKIENDETAFTFGVFSNRYMELKDVALDEFGWDEKGRYCEIDLTYATADGDKTYYGQVYYVINGIGELNIIECKTTTPEGDFIAPGDKAILWNDDYYTIKGINGDEILYDDSWHYTFVRAIDNYIAQDYIGDVEIRTGTEPNEIVIKKGKFTVDPRGEEETFDFVLKLCWDNGIVEKYYCESLIDAEGYVIRLNVYDKELQEYVQSDRIAIRNLPNYVREMFINAD